MFWLLFFLVVNSSCLVDAVDVCDVSNNTINCKNRHLTEVPKFSYKPNCETVYLNYNSIYTLPANAFASISDTSELYLYLDHNAISSIDEKAFIDLENITIRLFLHHNNPSVNSSFLGALGVFKNLTHLQVDGIDALDTLPVSSMKGSLEYLSLGLDNFTAWPHQLQEMKQLHTLKISGIQQLDFIPETAFKGIEASLEFLEVRESVVGSSLKAICSLPSLQSLTFDFVIFNDSNVIVSECNKTLESMWQLSLRFVNFPNLPNFFHAFPNISSLEISYTEEMQHISEDRIPSQNMLRHLNLMQNKLRQIPFAVQKMKHLEILDLSHNLITAVESNDVGELLHLRRLIIANNPIVFISDHAFSALPSLVFIDIRHLKLPAVPEALKQAANLTSVDIHGNPVVCQCNAIWLLSPPINGRLTGSCSTSTQSDLNIVEFLNNNCSHVP